MLPTFLRPKIYPYASAEIVLVLLLVAAPVAAQDRPITIGVAPYAAVLAGSSLDLGTTLHALQNPTLGEGNPFLQHGGTVGLVTVKVVSTAGAVWAMQFVARRGHPRVAKVFGYALAAGLTGAAISNARIARVSR